MCFSAEVTSDPVDLGALDLGTLALFVGQAAAEAVREGLADQGHPALRVSHGYVVQHLLAGPRAVSELAALLGVTQQAASKAVLELEELGYVASRPDAEDGRRRLVELSPRGLAVVESARRARRRLEEKLVRKHGAREVTRAKALLAAVLEDLGGAEAVRKRRVRSPA